MDTNKILQTAQDALAPLSDHITTPEENRLDVYISAGQLLEAADLLIPRDGCFLSAITGLDVPPTETTEGQIELLYHFCQGPAVITLRFGVPYSQPVAPSICALIPSATLYERELIEMFGVTLEGTPTTDKLLLPDDWPDGVYPLRKSFKGL